MLYDYKCDKCGVGCEVSVPMKDRDRPRKCGACGGDLKRQFSVPQLAFPGGRSENTIDPVRDSVMQVEALREKVSTRTPSRTELNRRVADAASSMREGGEISTPSGWRPLGSVSPAVESAVRHSSDSKLTQAEVAKRLQTMGVLKK